jgi:hypothetical protein
MPNSEKEKQKPKEENRRQASTRARDVHVAI